MKVGFMITEGGPHSAEKWPAVTASQIIQIAAEASGEQAVAGRRLELKILDILEAHHKAVAAHECCKLDDHGTDRYEHEICCDEHLEAPVNEIVAAAKGTPFEAHFAAQRTQDYIRAVLNQHFSTSMHIERCWHDKRRADAAGETPWHVQKAMENQG